MADRTADGAYEHAFDAARDRVAELAAADRLPPLTPYYTARTAPGYLPGILARKQTASPQVHTPVPAVVYYLLPSRDRRYQLRFGCCCISPSMRASDFGGFPCRRFR